MEVSCYIGEESIRRSLMVRPQHRSVDGQAYQVMSSDLEVSLLLYETAKYEVVRCTITLDGGKEVVKGCTFRCIVGI